MSSSTVRPTPAVPEPVDYLLAAMGSFLFGGVALGALTALSIRLAAGSGALVAAVLLAVALVRFP